jgi:hypothetical protein
MTESAKSAAVVAAWMGGNAVLLALLPFFDEQPFAIVLFAAALALPGALALAVVALAGRNAQPDQEFSLGANAIWALPAALGLVLIGVGSFSAVWLVWVGGIAVLAGCIQLLRGSAVGKSEVADGRS